jgi:hypothetical protein
MRQRGRLECAPFRNRCNSSFPKGGRLGVRNRYDLVSFRRPHENNNGRIRGEKRQADGGYTSNRRV